MPAVCNSMLPRFLSLGYHAYIICILSSVYSNLYHIFFFTYNWSHKLELLYTFMFLIFFFGILHDFLSLLKKYPYLKINMKASVFVFSYKQHILWMVTVWFYFSGVIFFGLYITTIHHSSTKLTTCRIWLNKLSYFLIFFHEESNISYFMQSLILL